MSLCSAIPSPHRSLLLWLRNFLGQALAVLVDLFSTVGFIHIVTARATGYVGRRNGFAINASLALIIHEASLA